MANNDVSVVIPHYNSADSISRAIRSVLAQTHPVREILIVDDESTPEQKQQLDKAASVDPRVRLLCLEKNAGPASARNAGWEAAQGGWIAFLDSDDAWHPRKLEVQMRAVAEYGEEVAMVGSDSVVLKDLEDDPVEFDLETIPTTEVSTWGLLFKNCFPTASVVLKAGLPARFTAGRRYSEDYELWLRVSALKLAVIQVDLPLAYKFKAHYGESGLSSNLLAMAKGELETFRNVYSAGALTSIQFVVASAFSVAKSVRRLIIVSLRRLGRLRRPGLVGD